MGICANVLPTVIPTLFGGLVTWLAAIYYYKRASRELAREAKELRQLTTIVLGALEAGGVYQLGRDASGNITGLKHTVSGTLVTQRATILASVTVTPAAAQQQMPESQTVVESDGSEEI